MTVQEERDSGADHVAADQVRSECSRRDGREEAVQPEPERPAENGAAPGTETDHKNGEQQDSISFERRG